MLTVITFVFLSESCAPVLLQRKAKTLRKQGVSIKEDNAGLPSQSAARAVLLRALTRPLRILTRSPIVIGLSLYLAVIYGYLYLLFTTFATVFPDQYGFDTGVLGLAFLGLGVGICLGLLVLSWFSDKAQASLTKKHGESKPE